MGTIAILALTLTAILLVRAIIIIFTDRDSDSYSITTALTVGGTLTLLCIGLILWILGV